MQEFLKIAFVLVTAPIWVPFLKAMKRELFDLFEEDGGLFGDDPGPMRRAAIRARRASQPGVLVHEWLAHVRAGAAPSASSPRRTDRGAQAGRVAPAVRPGQRTAPSTHRTPPSGGSDRPSFR